MRPVIRIVTWLAHTLPHRHRNGSARRGCRRHLATSHLPCRPQARMRSAAENPRPDRSRRHSATSRIRWHGAPGDPIKTGDDLDIREASRRHVLGPPRPRPGPRGIVVTSPTRPNGSAMSRWVNGPPRSEFTRWSSPPMRRILAPSPITTSHVPATKEKDGKRQRDDDAVALYERGSRITGRRLLRPRTREPTVKSTGQTRRWHHHLPPLRGQLCSDAISRRTT